MLEVWTSARRICSGFRLHSSLSCFFRPVYFSSMFNLRPYRTGVVPSSLMTVDATPQQHRWLSSPAKAQEIVFFFFFSRVCQQGLGTCDLQVHRAVHGQRQGQEVEGVEAGADVSARLALHLGLELAVEEVHHDGAVPPQVVLPRLWRRTHKHKTAPALTTGSLRSPTVGGRGSGSPLIGRSAVRFPRQVG